MPRLTVLALALGFVAGPVAADEVVVFAAASMKTALDEVAEGFRQRSGHRVIISYAGSGVLARQILAGAPADLFISASGEWMDVVEQGGELVAGSRIDLLGNRLVLIAHGEAEPVALDGDTDWEALLDGGRLAMALVDSVPAGQYGKAALTSLGAWESVAPMVAQADNVRAALALVATGEAPYGITYASDAAADPGVRIVATFPAGSHPPILYPAGLLIHAQDEADRAFLDHLRSAEAEAIFAAQGFLIPGSADDGR